MEAQGLYCHASDQALLLQMGHAHHARKHYSQEQALEWIIQIAKGLRYLHTSKPKVHALSALQESMLTLSSSSCPCSGNCTEIMHDMGLWRHQA